MKSDQPMRKSLVTSAKATLLSRKAIRVLEGILDDFEYAKDNEDVKGPQVSVVLGAANKLIDVANESFTLQAAGDPAVTAEVMAEMTDEELEALVQGEPQ